MNGASGSTEIVFIYLQPNAPLRLSSSATTLNKYTLPRIENKLMADEEKNTLEMHTLRERCNIADARFWSLSVLLHKTSGR